MQMRITGGNMMRSSVRSLIAVSGVMAATIISLPSAHAQTSDQILNGRVSGTILSCLPMKSQTTACADFDHAKIELNSELSNQSIIEEVQNLTSTGSKAAKCEARDLILSRMYSAKADVPFVLDATPELVRIYRSLGDSQATMLEAMYYLTATGDLAKNPDEMHFYLLEALDMLALPTGNDQSISRILLGLRGGNCEINPRTLQAQAMTTQKFLDTYENSKFTEDVQALQLRAANRLADQNMDIMKQYFANAVRGIDPSEPVAQRAPVNQHVRYARATLMRAKPVLMAGPHFRAYAESSYMAVRSAKIIAEALNTMSNEDFEKMKDMIDTIGALKGDFFTEKDYASRTAVAARFETFAKLQRERMKSEIPNSEWTKMLVK